jgi:biopolymer transport protein ExbD
MAARKPSDRRHGGSNDDNPEVNLAPIMAIMVILIPILIYMFTFHQIKVQRVMAPRKGTGAQKTKEEKKEKELNLTILIKKDRGFQVTWEQALMEDGAQASETIQMRQVDDQFCGDPSDRKKVRSQGCWPRAEGCFCYDFAGLYNELVRKKNKFSRKDKPEKRVNISAESKVTWEVVSRTMDAATCRLEHEVYNDFSEYVSAKLKKGESKKIPGVDDPVEFCDPLFPNIVFAMAE